MPKNSKVTQREHSNEHVTESVADLLALEEPVDYKQSVLNVAGEAGGKQKAAEESSVQSLKSCPALCDLMDYSTPGLLVHHQLPEFTQTHIH